MVLNSLKKILLFSCVGNKKLIETMADDESTCTKVNMRKYCIHFEPFLNSFKNKFIGIDLSFWSEYLTPEEIVKILDETFDEMSVNNLNGLKTSLCQKFGLKDVKLSTYKTSIKWFKDGDYHKYSRKKQKRMVKTYPENEVHLTAFNISGKPYLERSEKLFDEILIVDYSSTELHWTYEISRTTTVARLKTYGYILVRDESGDRKSPYVEYVGSTNARDDFVPDLYFRKWDCPILHMMTYPCIRKIVEHIGNVTVENVFEVAPSYNDLVD